MKRENNYQQDLVKRIKKEFPGCMVLHNDPNYIQGIPDLLILYKNFWAALETKRSSNASRRVNQEWYVTYMNNMSYAAFISPENEEVIFDELKQAFQLNRTACFSESK